MNFNNRKVLNAFKGTQWVSLDKSDHIIRKLNWRTLTTPEYLARTLDFDNLLSFVNNLPIQYDSGLSKLYTKMLRFLMNKYNEGFIHCDTQENKDCWRLQFWVNICIYPPGHYVVRSRKAEKI